MKYFLQILLLLLTWFTNTVNATPLIIKVVLPSYELTFSQTKNVKEESVTKIGFQNFVRSGISEKSQPLNATLRENYVLEESRARMSREDVSGVGRHADWVEITGITSKIDARMPHVDYLDFKVNGFEGCHTQNPMNQYLANNPGWTGGFVDANGSAIVLIDNVAIEAYPWVKDINGSIFTKTNGAQKTINGVQYGKASFFPKNWSTAKLKAEVEYAISNNHGLVTGNTYKGFSTDGTVEIWFYYNTSNGSIISFFPKVN